MTEFFRKYWTVLFATTVLCISTLTHASSPSYTVVLIDKFYPGHQAYSSDEARRTDLALYGMLDLDSDREREPYYHGDLVRIIVEHPLIEVVPYPLNEGEAALSGLLRNLQQVHLDMVAGAEIDALLFPWESSTLVSAFDPDGMDRESVDAYLDTLESWSDDSDTWKLTTYIIAELEWIAAQGTQVYTIAGNGGPRMVNTYSFARGVITVGSSHAELSHFISENEFVDVREKAHYRPERIDDRLGNVMGYDLSGNGCVDISKDQLSTSALNTLPQKHWKLLKGSSFAAPMALKKDLVGEVGAEYCL